MAKINFNSVGLKLLAALMAISAGSCAGKSDALDSDVVEEIPTIVYRHWDKGLDDEFYKLPDDKRFKIDFPNGESLLFGVDEDGETQEVYGVALNGVEQLVIPSEVELGGKKYKVSVIARLAFTTYDTDSIKWMEGVKEIVVEEGIENCGSRCFEGAPDLIRVSLPKSLTSIGYRSMAGCKGLEDVAIPADSKLLGIMDYAFMDCLNLKEFKIPASVRRIRQGAWRNCKALPAFTLEEGNPHYKVEDGVLYTLSGSELVQYPAGKTNKEYIVASGVSDIDDSAFYGNEYLEKVKLPHSLKAIQHYAFGNCTSLKEVVFNIGLEWIGNAAFENCKSLKEVRLGGNTEYTKDNLYGTRLLSIDTQLFEG